LNLSLLLLFSVQSDLQRLLQKWEWNRLEAEKMRKWLDRKRPLLIDSGQIVWQLRH
jgi:hypothetical protein